MPREGHDLPKTLQCCAKIISIHVPREGHDLGAYNGLVRKDGFQSTCPARGTTNPTAEAIQRMLNFNPRAPRGARRGTSGRAMIYTNFNPRAPRGARQSILDLRPSAKSISIHVPREGHDDDYRAIMQADAISIHVPREGHDYRWKNLPCSLSNFNPRAPRGARLSLEKSTLLAVEFQSTCPARGTTLQTDRTFFARY